MVIRSVQQFAGLFLAFRRSARKHLYDGSSAITTDLLMLLFSNFADGKEPLSVKELLLKLPYSAVSSRYHLYDARGRGLVSLSSDSRDKRILRIRPTDKLLDAFAAMQTDLSPFLTGDISSLRS